LKSGDEKSEKSEKSEVFGGGSLVREGAKTGEPIELQLFAYEHFTT